MRVPAGRGCPVSGEGGANGGGALWGEDAGVEHVVDGGDGSAGSPAAFVDGAEVDPPGGGGGVGSAGVGHGGEGAFDDVGADLGVPVGVHDGDVDMHDVLAGVGGQDAADGDHVGGAFGEMDLEADAGEFDELADLRD